MSKINIESKNALARLMATENLTVQHSKIATASFDVKNRVLNLPIWEAMDDTMYEGLIGHEVGHALYTPFEEWKGFVEKHPNLRDYANVIEDARIEKKMKTKFPGMRKTFFGMYDQLNVRDFFGTHGKDLTTYGILDRINLHFKLGTRADVTFTDTEMLFVDRVAAAETFEEVLALTLELSDYAKDEELNTDFDDMDFDDFEITDSEEEANGTAFMGKESENGEDGSGEDGEVGDEDTDGGDQEGSFMMDDDSETAKDGNDSDSGAGGENDVPPGSKTQEAFDGKMESLNDEYAKTPIYVKLPNVNTKGVTIGYKKVATVLTPHFKDHKNYSYWDADSGTEIMEKFNDEIRAWKKDTMPVVNYMVKEFEMKQAASAHRRTSVGKTGVLDTNKMHAYRYEEDIFKRVATVKDGRNHALIIYVDWSGSMNDKILATVKQTLTLVMFARKVGIPFRVYGFSNSSGAKTLAGNDFYGQMDNENYGFNHLQLNSLALVEYFNEKMNAKEFNNAIDNFYSVGASNDGRSQYISTPEGFHLASTPLNECIIAAYEQVANFKRETGKEKVNVIFLTDGQSNGNTSYYNAVERGNQYGYGGYGDEAKYMVITDPKSNKVISNSPYGENVTGDLLRGLGVRCDVNVIGFFLTQKRSITYKIDSTCKWEDGQKTKKFLQKNGYVSLPANGYDKYFMVNDTAMDKEVEFKEVESKEDGSVNKAKLRTAFKNFSKGRKVNKMLLNEFVAMVA